jgi:hypothetical protein
MCHVRTGACYEPAVAAWAAVNAAHAGFRVLLTLALLGAGPSVALAREPSPSPAPLPERVLFIGNSHTERNGGLAWLIGNMAAASDPPIPFEGSAITEGGENLEYHWNHGAADKIREGRYDAVVLQGYLPASEAHTTASFLEYSKRFDEVIRASGAETYFFMTWPRGYDDWSTMDDVVAAHRQVALELGAPVAPAALAFERSEAERPDLVLIGPDQVHADWDGAYLAALTVYATLFDRDPEGIAYHFGLTEDDAAFYQRIAWETVLDWRASISADEAAASANPPAAASPAATATPGVESSPAA